MPPTSGLGTSMSGGPLLKEEPSSRPALPPALLRLAAVLLDIARNELKGAAKGKADGPLAVRRVL